MYTIRFFHRTTPFLVAAAGLVLLFAGQVFAQPVVLNKSFEDGPLNAAPGYGPVQDWALTGNSGNNDGSGPFLNNLPVPNLSRVGFIQGNGSFTQTVNGFQPGKSYSVRYLQNERGSGVGTEASPEVSLGGSIVVPAQNITRTEAFRRVQSQAFTATSASEALVLSNTAGGVGDNTLLLDFVEVVRAVPIVANGGFDDFGLAPATFQYNPIAPAVAWAFTGGGGLSRNGSGFQSANVNAIEGQQAGFIQNGGSASQTITGFEVGATYSFRWLEQSRSGAGGNDLNVLVDGASVSGPHIVSDTLWVDQTSNDFIATSSSLTLSFASTNPQGGDRTVLFDDTFFNFVDENDAPIAVANGAYVFDANNLSLALDSAGSLDPENLALAFSWDDAGGAVAVGANPTISLADTNLSMTTSSEVLTLTVTDTGSLSGGDTALVSYLNADPNVVSVGANNLPDFSIDFLGALDDLDLAANLLVAGFEDLTWEFDLNPATLPGDIGDGFLGGLGTSASGNLDLASQLLLFGNFGQFTAYLNVKDKAGQVDSLAINVEVVPEPSTLSLAILGMISFVAYRRRRT